MATSDKTESGTIEGKEGQRGGHLPEVRPSADNPGSAAVAGEGETAHCTVIDGVAVPDSPEDAEVCRRFAAKIGADPEKYRDHVWAEAE